MQYFFTSDQHYGHANIIRYCNRPFNSVEEMDETLILNHNSVVRAADTVVHVGDFTMRSNANKYIDRLIGNHIFLRGSHDNWMKRIDKTFHEIWECKIGNQYLVACHYAMRIWPRSHYNSWLVYGHSHGRLPPIGKQWDVGVDNNNFYPVSLPNLVKIMEKLPDNPNLLKKRKNSVTSS